MHSLLSRPHSHEEDACSHYHRFRTETGVGTGRRDDSSGKPVHCGWLQRPVMAELAHVGQRGGEPGADDGAGRRDDRDESADDVGHVQVPLGPVGKGTGYLVTSAEGPRSSADSMRTESNIATDRSGAVCQACPAFRVCTRAKEIGRSLAIGPHDAALRRHRAWMATSAAKQAYKLRKQLVEPVFGMHEVPAPRTWPNRKGALDIVRRVPSQFSGIGHQGCSLLRGPLNCELFAGRSESKELDRTTHPQGLHLKPLSRMPEGRYRPSFSRRGCLLPLPSLSHRNGSGHR